MNNIIYSHFSMHTEHTIMSKLERIRVHIAPLGFEVDRIVLPAKKMKADKVWIIQEIKPEKEIAKPYREEILKKLGLPLKFELILKFF